MSKHLRILIAILITLTSLTSAGTVSVAQETGRSESFTSHLTRSVVEISDTSEGAFLHEFHSSGDTGYGYVQEDIHIEHGFSEVIVSFVHGDVNPQKWNDDSFADLPSMQQNYAIVLGAGADAEQSWFMTRHSDLLDIDQHLYSEFMMDIGNGHTAAVYVYANSTDLISTIQWAHDNVTLDGYDVFAHADLDEIQAMLDGTSSFEPIRLEGFTSDVDYWSNKGLISANEWHSPEYGHTITWNDSTPWEFPFYFDFAVRNNPTSGDRQIILQREDYAALSWVTFVESEGRTAADYADRWSSEEWLIETGRQFPVLAVTNTSSESAIIAIWHTPQGDLLVNIQQGVVMPDGTVLVVNMHATPKSIVQAYLDLVSILELNGKPIDQLWTQAELEEIISPLADSASPPADDSQVDDSSTVTRTSRGSDDASSPEASDSMLVPVSGVTIDLGPSGEAVFVSEQPFLTEYSQYTKETVSLERGTAYLIIDVMEGDVNVDDYMLQSESDIAATFDYMDWLGGEWTDSHAWDLYSGAYKLDYREFVYLELVHDPDSGLYFGIGVYSSGSELPEDISWLQSNVTIDGQSILAAADPSSLQAVLDGSSDFIAEPVPMNETTVADWADAGLVSETEWQSPFTDTSFTWDGTDLVFPFAQSDALTAEDGVTTLELRTNDRRGEVKLSTAEVPHAPADWVANYLSDEFQESQEAIGQPITILDSRVTDETGSVVLLFHTDFDDPVVTIVDVYVNEEGVTILTEISAAPEDIADVYAIVWDSVQSNGDYYPLTWDVEEIGAFETAGQ